MKAYSLLPASIQSLLDREWHWRRKAVCDYLHVHLPAESVRDDGVRLCAICHEPLKESE